MSDIATILQQGFAQLQSQLSSLSQQITTANYQPPQLPEGFFTPQNRASIPVTPCGSATPSTVSQSHSPKPQPSTTKKDIPPYLREKREIAELPPGKSQESCAYAQALRFFKATHDFIRGKPMTAQSESSRNAVLAAMCQLYPNMNPKVHAQKLSNSCINQTHFQKHKENKPPKRAAQEQAKNHAEMMEKYNSVISGDVQAPKVQLSFLFY
jgi:hypothetical protein